uniref:Receptor-type tyrosine-protein phosphatase U-like n=1 Tax=Crassostrea virginica TaxID=6565 RepID=A0A8B8C8N0_CRAVI|nr:receptor-type tyrosine-protein phosphatase U-like [Crassostrea virginica]
MAVKLICCLLLYGITNVHSYHELVIPGKTEAISNSVHGSFFPNKSVDGSFLQNIAYCSHTSDNTSITVAWLRIDLKKIYSIKAVKFWYRNDRSSEYYNTIRLRGYSIRVSNGTNVPPAESSCYTDPGGTTLPTIIENSCIATARYIWFYQPNKNNVVPMLEICEVQVFGCDTGWFGFDCSEKCDHCMNNATCGIEQGECDTFGCAHFGVQPPLCKENCLSGFYGKDCSESCGHCLGHSACDPVDGSCSNGCEPGWQQTASRKCDIACSRNTYGTDCTHKCSGNCWNGEPCNTVNGSCVHCMPGWKNEFCNKTCSDGMYGVDCLNTCSGHCLNGISCNRIDGTCPECMPGWQNHFCSEPCASGTYGYNCSKSCGHCLGTSACDPVEGRCTHGCEPGWQPPPKCDKHCSDGTFGKECMYNCSGNCLDREHCNKVDGRCTQCMPGWENNFCNKTCDNGSYGPGCDVPCGHCFGSDICHHINGSCPGNCTDGYTGEKCTEACDDGWYGPACQNQCGHCLKGDVCFHTNGSCPGICSDGYLGDRCVDPCPHGSYGPHCQEKCGHCFAAEACLNTNGRCAGKCSDGFRGDKCSDSCKNGWYGPGCETPCGHCLGSEVCHHINGSCPGNFTDGYTGETCPKIDEKISFRDEKSQNSDLIAIPVAIIIIIMVIVAIIIFLLRWKRRHTFRQKLEDENVYYLPDIIKEDGNEYEELKNIEGTSFYKNQQFKPESLQHSSSGNRTKPIMIMDLWSTIHNLEKHSNIGFKREFESISSDVSECSCKAGKLRMNFPKKRYATTLPYDHSRVVLSSTRNDYINANIIKNARGEPAYIATQGPTSNTMCEFWGMVWQEKIRVIATTTYHVHGCEDIDQNLSNYITSSVQKGTFLIQLISDKTYACFKIRHIQITCKENKEIRLIKHLEFTAWPKQSTPPPLELLVYYHYILRSMEEYPENKLLVHCSSGTGPTAVIIALDALHKQGMTSGMISISKFVGDMRKDRMEMIQNVEQYICLHYVLYESFRAKSYVQSKDTLLTEDILAKINDEFNILSSIRPADVCFEIRQKKSKDSEYENMISEGDYYRLDALDAVLQSSFTTRNCIIAGRYPSHDEAVALIRLLVDHKCTTLVSINPLTEVPYSKEWYSQFEKVQNFQVEVIQGPKISEHIMLSTLRMKALSDVDWQQMTLYEITSWNFSEKIPADVNAILDLINFVQVDKHVAEKTKLVILSKDGATGCGVFCAVYNAIQQLQKDEEVDMFTIVRQLQSRRPEMISDLSEYLFCYQAVTQYIKRK